MKPKRPCPKSYQSRADVFIVPRTKEKNYPQPFDDRTLAHALGLQPSALWFFLREAKNLYKRHTILKKSGGTRTLHEPDERLGYTQDRILRRFLNRVDWPEHVAAYVPGRRIVDAAAKHAGRPVLVVLDLKDFFTSTTRWQVRDAFCKELGLAQGVAEMLATLTTTCMELPAKDEQAPRRFGWRVPQGAPTSGAVANLVAVHRLDPRVLAVCARFGMTYTRYADDLAFSREMDLPYEEARAFIYAIAGAIHQAGFQVNWDKVRVRRPHRQQRLLGLTLNRGVNIPKKERRRMRATVHQCRTQGLEVVAQRNGFQTGEELEQYLLGMLAYYQGIRPDRADELRAGLSRPERARTAEEAAE